MTDTTPIQNKFNPRDAAITKIIELLEKTPEAWKKTWELIGSPTSRPFNPISKTYYKGVNMISLGLVATDNKFTDNRWCTYEQAKNAGHPVSRGESSKAFVVYHQTTHIINIQSNEYTIKNKTELDVCHAIAILAIKHYPSEKSIIKNILDECITLPSKKMSKSESLTNDLKNQLKTDISHQIRTYAKHAPVFNFNQMENVPVREITQGYTWDPYERAEKILESSGIPIYHDQVNKNYYRPGVHDIHLTLKSAFKTPEAYYATALHELSHAKINDGSLLLSFDPGEYNKSRVARAKEELRAEISSIFICAEIGLNYDIQNHTAYLHSWLNILKENKNEFWTAVSESNRITDAIFSTELTYLNSLGEKHPNIPDTNNKEVNNQKFLTELPITEAKLISQDQNLSR